MVLSKVLVGHQQGAVLLGVGHFVDRCGAVGLRLFNKRAVTCLLICNSCIWAIAGALSSVKHQNEDGNITPLPF